MVEQNILEPSTSPWGAPCLLVKKKTEHGLQVTPRLVDKLIKVEPWSVNETNPKQTNRNEEEDTPPEISQSHSNPQFENGSFIVYEKLGDFFDDDIRIMIEELHAWLKSQKDYKSSTGEACKYLYTKNPEFKKILQSIGGIRQLLIHTPSIQFEMPDASGGKNSLKLLDASQIPFRPSRRTLWYRKNRQLLRRRVRYTTLG
jgi:hypothetical protein